MLKTLKPADGSAEDRWLRALGTRLRDARTALSVSSTSAAQSAGVSRMTWHRMESGSPSVSAGAYARALIVLGIANEDDAPAAPVRPAGMIPTRIRIGDWPELAALSWSMQPDTMLTPREALAVYERNGRHIDAAKLTDAERSLIDDLRDGFVDDVHA